MICEEIRAALAEDDVCEETDRGARIVTHCLYPSFEPVEIFVAKHGDGYLVSDGGGAVRSAWMHGREEIGKLLAKEAARYGIAHREDSLEAKVTSSNWLKAAILSVANASSSAATISLERVAVAAEKVLADRILEALSRVISPAHIAQDYDHRGASGKRWRYDFAVTANDNLALLNAVTPHPVSISAKYVAFADTGVNDPNISKLAVFGRHLETPDIALITQVASLVPIDALEGRARLVLRHQIHQ